MSKITYTDKVDLNVDNTIANINKVTANDMNEIKIAVNDNDDNITGIGTDVGDLDNLTTTAKTDLVSAINELNTNKLDKTAIVNSASTQIDEAYSADYLNDKTIAVGTTLPTDGRRVLFKKSNNLIDYGTLANSNTTYTFTNNTLTVTSSGTYANAYKDITQIYKDNHGKTLRFDFGSITSQVTPNVRIVGLRIVTSSATNVTLVGADKSITPYAIPDDTSNVTAVTITFYANNTNTATANTLTITNPMLHFGTNEMSYEPYVKPSIYVDGIKIYEMS